MSLSDLSRIVFELLWPFVFVFSFVVLVKASIRRRRNALQKQFKYPRWLFLVAAIVSLGIYILIAATGLDPLTDRLFLQDKLNEEEARLFFMTVLAVLLVLIPMMTTPLICKIWPMEENGTQRDSV